MTVAQKNLILAKIEKNQSANVGTNGVEPAAVNIVSDVLMDVKSETKEDVILDIPNYNAWHLYGCEVLKPMLQNCLVLVLDDCFIGKFGVGNFDSFWKACLGGSAVVSKIAESLTGVDALRLKAIGRAMRLLHIEGLSEDAMLVAYTACKGLLVPSDALANEFTAACRAKRQELVNVDTVLSMPELRYNFETGTYAAFLLDRDGKNEKSRIAGKAHYDSLNK